MSLYLLILVFWLSIIMMMIVSVCFITTLCAMPVVGGEEKNDRPFFMSILIHEAGGYAGLQGVNITADISSSPLSFWSGRSHGDSMITSPSSARWLGRLMLRS
jgi:hypothetical protein